MDNPNVDKDNYDWKSNNIGADKVIISPEKPKFKFGTIWIAVEGFRQNLNHLALSIKVKENRPIKELKNGEQCVCTVNDIEFFKYKIDSIVDFE